MKEIAVSDTRNFVFMGHTGSGKTSLVEALLYKMGINYLSKGFKLADLKERIPNLKSENKKMQEFVSQN